MCGSAGLASGPDTAEERGPDKIDYSLHICTFQGQMNQGYKYAMERMSHSECLIIDWA